MTKRMRVFAGPNGSGKSSIIKNVLKTKVGKGKTLDFGIYINADDLAVLLLRSEVDFSGFLPTPAPPFKREGRCTTIPKIMLHRVLPNAGAPLPAGREGLGVGRFDPILLFEVESRFEECKVFSDNSIALDHVATGRHEAKDVLDNSCKFERPILLLCQHLLPCPKPSIKRWIN
ncbi:MAG TPA: hypothetical protein PLK82_08045 [Bacteroidales bacterium]|nr:hypothetical protein [Bacteroidales bacterium]